MSDDDGGDADVGQNEQGEGVVEGGGGDDAVGGNAAADAGEHGGCGDGSDAE